MFQTRGLPGHRLACALLLLAGCAQDADRLVGTWELPAGDGRRYSFFADGTARILVPAPPGSTEPLAVSARYTLADSVLTLADEQGAERFVVHVRGDTLVLRVPEAFTRTTLVRARPDG